MRHICLAWCLCLKEMGSSCPKSRQTLLAAQPPPLQAGAVPVLPWGRGRKKGVEQGRVCTYARAAGGEGGNFQLHGILNLPG